MTKILEPRHKQAMRTSGDAHAHANHRSRSRGGGLAAALTLGRSGFEVLLFEQAPVLREIGAGVQISPNAKGILRRLGLEEPLRRFGVRPRAVVIRRWPRGM
jgi:hypothetical protein